MKITYFSAKWCTPCNTFGPLLEEVLKDYPQIELEKQDMDSSAGQYVGHQYGIRSIPSMVVPNQPLVVGTMDEKALRAYFDKVTGE